MVSELSKREEQVLPDERDGYFAPRHASQCPVEDWLTFLGHRWNALILWRLSERSHGFSELMEALPGITPKVMTERLSGLVERGLVSRSAVATFPRRTTYALTQSGQDISGLLKTLYEWHVRC